jgi:hypothetical protein
LVILDYPVGSLNAKQIARSKIIVAFELAFLQSVQSGHPPRGLRGKEQACPSFSMLLHYPFAILPFSFTSFVGDPSLFLARNTNKGGANSELFLYFFI